MEDTEEDTKPRELEGDVDATSAKSTHDTGIYVSSARIEKR